MGMDLKPLVSLSGFDAVCCSGDEALLKSIRISLAAREGALIPLITSLSDPFAFHLERHVCVDTTASGGNAALLASQSASAS